LPYIELKPDHFGLTCLILDYWDCRSLFD